MMENWRVALSWGAGVAAIVSLPAFVWIGWWQLAVSVGLAATAAIVAPRPEHLPTESGEHHRTRGWWEGWLHRRWGRQGRG